jgi:chaperonin GroES
MPEKFIPRGDRILVRPIEPPARKPGGLATPSAQKAKATRGTVVAMGRQVFQRFEDGVRIDNPEALAVGDIIEWNDYAGKEIRINGETFRRLRLEEVEGRWETVDG